MRRLALVVVAVLALAGAACGGNSDATAGGSAASTVAAGSVPQALQWSAPLVGEGQLDAANYGGRPVAFWFWASW